MATRSRVGYKVPGTEIVRSVYVHYDGYPSARLPILNENFNTLEKIQELVSFGDISVIAPKVHPTTDTHSFDIQENDVCVFYHRDRNEPLNVIEETEDSFWNNTSSSEEYLYLFEDGEWWVKSIHPISAKIFDVTLTN